jgi:hypothetical protein
VTSHSESTRKSCLDISKDEGDRISRVAVERLIRWVRSIQGDNQNIVLAQIQARTGILD